MEALALALAPRPFPRDALADLEGIVAECDRYVAALDRRRYTAADIRLHERLVEAGGNERLVWVYQDLQGQIQVVRLRAIVLPGRPQRSHAEHRAIVAALRGGDLRAAERLLRAHIRAVKEDVLRALAAGADAPAAKASAAVGRGPVAAAGRIPAGRARPGPAAGSAARRPAGPR